MEKSKRLLYIDYLRGLAVIVMIEVHVVNAFLIRETRAEWWFVIVNYINGLVAPSFLFITGFAFIIVSERKWENYLSGGKYLRKQLLRILQIILIGYALHLPYFSYKKYTNTIPEQMLTTFLKIDILHCIAISLFLMLMFILIFRKKEIVLSVLVVLTLLIVFLSPIVWSTSFLDLPKAFAMYLNAEQGSLFPIFPWMGFVFLGGISAFIFSKYKEKEKIFEKIIYISIAIIFVTIVVRLISPNVLLSFKQIQPSPSFFFQRAAIVTLLLGLFGFIESKNKLPNSFINIAGSESLVVYTAHLLIIFGLFFDGKSLSSIVGTTQTFQTTLFMSFVLILLMCLTAYVWNFIKNKNILYARIIQYTILAVTLILFFSGRF
ncbi:MAG: heparan-alpha-glucosaminide N-acetyltransferase domain-containing protein [Bacteroidota bacterium]